MEALHVLIVIGILHLTFFFFNTIFVTCMHLPYLSLLRNLGLEIQLFRIKWFTTVFNRSLMKWGLKCSKFWSLWFNAGLVTTIVLLPISVLVILKVTFSNLWLSKSEFPTGNKDKAIELMIPGVDIPYNQMGYYVLSLLLSISFHELGHAMAAVRDDVRFFGLGMILFFVIPIAFVNISSEQLKSLPAKNHLRIMCAGIWHNIVLATLAIILMGAFTFGFAPFFKIGAGVYVKDISTNSPLLGPSGLLVGDVVHKINDCSVKNSTNWRTCILQATQLPTPGYCITDKMVKEIDKARVTDASNGNFDCCNQHDKDKGYLCFEYLEFKYARHYCLPTRAIVESSHGSCQNNDQCLMMNDLCIKPTLDNVTKIVQIQRYGRKDVLFFGHPSDIYYSTDLSDWIPRFAFLTPYFPEVLILLCKYIAVFSSGLAIINVVPCFYFDGQHIAAVLIDSLLKNKIHQQSARAKISLTITTVFTLLLGFNLINLYLNK